MTKPPRIPFGETLLFYNYFILILFFKWEKRKSLKVSIISLDVLWFWFVHYGNTGARYW